MIRFFFRNFKIGPYYFFFSSIWTAMQICWWISKSHILYCSLSFFCLLKSLTGWEKRERTITLLYKKGLFYVDDTVSKLPGSTKLRSILRRQCGSKPYLTLPNALFGKNESSIYFDRIIFVSYLYFFSLVLYFWLLYYFSFIVFFMPFFPFCIFLLHIYKTKIIKRIQKRS